MGLLKKNGYLNLKKLISLQEDTEESLKAKRALIENMKFNKPLISWPSDRDNLLGIINAYLARLEVEEMGESLDAIVENQETSETVVENKESVNSEKSDDKDSKAEDKTDKASKVEDKSEAKESSNNDKLEDKKETTDEKSDNTESKEAVEKNSEIEFTDEKLTPDTSIIDEENKGKFDSQGNAYLEESEYIDLPEAIYEIESCTDKVLGCIIRILWHRSKILRKIKLMKLYQALVETVNVEIEKVAIYNLVLAKFLPIVNNQRNVDVITLKKANKVFESVCLEGYEDIPTQSNIEAEIKKNKEDQDFDIVSALAYCGVKVDRDATGHYSITQESNGNGIKYYIGKQEKSLSMSVEGATRFVENFLNKPIETRKFITPGRVFINYISEAEKSLGLDTRSAVELENIFGAMNQTKSAKQYFKEVIKKYSRNAEEWKNFQKLYRVEFYTNKEKDDTTNKIHIKQQAKRLVIGDMFSEFVNGDEILSKEQIAITDYRIGDIARDFGLDIDLEGINIKRSKIEWLEDQAFRVINTMHDFLLDMKAFTQDIIDNYTVDYLRKEKIFLLQQDDQNEYISKKKDYEDLIEKLSFDKAKDSTQQIAYYQAQVDELTQQIGNKEYIESKAELLKAKDSFRILLLNAKSQGDLVRVAINEALDKANETNTIVTPEQKIEIVRKILGMVPELAFNFSKGKATYISKDEDKPIKEEIPLSEVDKIIETTTARISNESHQKILEENKIRESIKKAEKEDRVKSANAYINAYGSIVGQAGGIGGFGGGLGGVVQPPVVPAQPVVSGGVSGGSYGGGAVGNANSVGGTIGGEAPVYHSTGNESGLFGTMSRSASAAVVGTSGIVLSNPAPVVAPAAPVAPTSTVSTSSREVYSEPAPSHSSGMGGMPSGTTIIGDGMASMLSAGMMNMMSSGMFQPQPNNPNANRDYQNFDYLSEGVEPCVLPFIVGYESKGANIYGNMLENYATFDRYKYLLTTNNNSLYTYIEDKQSKIQTPEQIIADMHTRYLKTAMAKSGLSTLDSNLAKFDYKAELRKFVSLYVPQNLVDMVMGDYNDLCNSIDFDMLRDLIDHKFNGDLESYIPENIKNDAIKSTNMIASVVKAITTDPQVRKTYEAYSNKMKQTYINSLVCKIDSGEIPTIKLSSDDMYPRLIDYISFSIKAQNVIIQSEDSKANGLDTYPRGIFFRQKDNADTKIKLGKVLSFEENELITTRNDPKFDDLGSDVVNLFGTLYKFNGAYNKLLLKLKPYYLKGGIKFVEGLIDALKEKLDVKAVVLENNTNVKPKTNLVKFASKEKEKKLDASDVTFDYDDDKWLVRRGFVLDKTMIPEYYMLIAFGIKYGTDRSKTKLKADFYDKDMLSLTKINEAFNNLQEDEKNLIVSVIRTVYMSNCERFIDYIDFVHKRMFEHINKMLYINRMIVESGNFDKKTKDEKLETIDALEFDFDTKANDIKNPHPEIYSGIEEIEHYEKLYMFYSLTELFKKYADDKRIISPELETYFDERKKKLRNDLLVMIRDHLFMNGYEKEVAIHFELNIDKILDLSDKPIIEKEEVEEVEEKERVQIQNIDIIFRGICEGFTKASKDENSTILEAEIEQVKQILDLVGTLPSHNVEEKDLEIALPNNQAIICNIKGFIQQYLFRFIVDREHELGPFAYVVAELAQHEELGEIVKNLEIVANVLNEPELGINLFEKFSSINLSNDGNVFRIGDNISTVVEIVNRLKTPTDMQKALNRDIFYKEGVLQVQKSFEQYFNRRKLENLD